MRFKATEMWFYISILRIPRIENVSNEEALQKMETKTTQEKTVENSRPRVRKDGLQM